MTPADLIARLRAFCPPENAYPRVPRGVLLACADALAEHLHDGAQKDRFEVSLLNCLGVRNLLSAELERQRTARAELSTALRDCLSTFRDDDKTTVITGDRQEMWRHVLETYGEPAP